MPVPPDNHFHHIAGDDDDDGDDGDDGDDDDDDDEGQMRQICFNGTI